VTLISVIASRAREAVAGKRYGAWRGSPQYVPVFAVSVMNRPTGLGDRPTGGINLRVLSLF
jgi:hypothetical protein